MTTGPGGGSGTGPSGPSGPGPGRNLAGEMLRAIDNQLAELLEIADKLPEPTDRFEESGQAILAFRLSAARLAVADLLAYPETPARQGLSVAAAVTDGPDRTTRWQAGECLTPGSVAAFSGAATESGGAVVAPVAGAISSRDGKDVTAGAASRLVKPRAGQPPLPGADFLPEMSPGRARMAAAFARRAD
jgi:hypothetical protein